MQTMRVVAIQLVNPSLTYSKVSITLATHIIAEGMRCMMQEIYQINSFINKKRNHIGKCQIKILFSQVKKSAQLESIK